MLPENILPARLCLPPDAGFGYWLQGWKGVAICAILGVLETSLSFDNAVVNATVLRDMSQVWRKRFSPGAC